MKWVSGSGERVAFPGAEGEDTNSQLHVQAESIQLVESAASTTTYGNLKRVVDRAEVGSRRLFIQRSQGSRAGLVLVGLIGFGPLPGS